MLHRFIARHWRARRAPRRPRVKRGTDGVLRARRCFRLRQRARRLLRAARRVVPHGRAGARLRGDRGAVDDGRRRHAVYEQGPDVHGGADQRRGRRSRSWPIASSTGNTRRSIGWRRRISRARYCVMSTACWRRRASRIRRWRFDFWDQVDRARRARRNQGLSASAFLALPWKARRTRTETDDRQPMGAGGAQGRRDRRFGAPRARAAARARAPIRSLRDDHRRRPARRCDSVDRRRRDPRRSDDFSFCAGVADDGGVCAADLGARAAVSQRHAGAFLRRLRRRHLPARHARSRGLEVAGRPYRPGVRRFRVQPPGARVARVHQHRRVSDRRRHRANHRRATAAGARDRCCTRKAGATSSSSAASSRTRRSKITSSSPSTTSATSTSSTASSSSARPTPRRGISPPSRR